VDEHSLHCVRSLRLPLHALDERVQARGTPGRFAWSFGWPPAAQAQRRSRVSSATTPRRTAGALHSRVLQGRRLPRVGLSGPALAPRGTCSAPMPWQRTISGTAVQPLTWPPRGRWPRTGTGLAEGGLSARDLPAKSAPYLAPRVYQINPTMNDTPSRAAPGGRVRLVPVDAGRAGQRLDNFLMGQLKGAPRSLVYKIVRSGQVRVNGGRARPETRLEAGDEVRIPPVRLDEREDRGTPAKGLLEAMAASIVFEDARLLAINKPSGIASHGGSGIAFGVIETLRALRPGEALELVHRLDRDTSG